MIFSGSCAKLRATQIIGLKHFVEKGNYRRRSALSRDNLFRSDGYHLKQKGRHVGQPGCWALLFASVLYTHTHLSYCVCCCLYIYHSPTALPMLIRLLLTNYENRSYLCLIRRKQRPQNDEHFQNSHKTGHHRVPLWREEPCGDSFSLVYF